MALDLISFFDELADMFVEAAAKDLADKDTRAAMRQLIDDRATAFLGIDVNMPLVKPIWNRIISGAEENIVSYVAVAAMAPPDSVTAAATLLKEEAGSKIDTLAEKLKRRLAETKPSQEKTPQEG